MNNKISFVILFLGFIFISNSMLNLKTHHKLKESSPLSSPKSTFIFSQESNDVSSQTIAETESNSPKRLLQSGI